MIFDVNVAANEFMCGRVRRSIYTHIICTYIEFMFASGKECELGT